MKRLATIFCSVLALVFVAPGCDRTDSTDVTPLDGKPSLIRRGNGDDPGTLDPALAEDVHTFNVLIDLYEGLVAEAANGDLISGAAESWKISDDGIVYRFKLRSDARWSNGEPVVAANFVNAFRRVAAPDTQSSYAFLLEPLKNFNDVNSGIISVNELGVVALDDNMLEIHLRTPSSHFLSVLTMPVAFPVYGANPSLSQFSNPEEFVGNGAYVLADRQLGGTIRLRRNDQYWGSDSVSVDEIEYLPIIDPVAELNQYRAGELDITGTVPASHFKSLQESAPSELRVAPELAFYYLAFDLTEAPLNNPALRQALSMAIDRETLTSIIGRGEQPAYGVVPSGVANHISARYAWRTLSRSDRGQRAQQLYRNAGYGDGNPLKMKLTYDVGDIHERVALAVSSMWTDVLGIDVELDKKEWKLFLDTRDDRPSWQTMRFSWFGDYNDAKTFTDIFRSDNDQNLPRYASDGYDSILDRAERETDPQRRAQLSSQAEEILINDYPIAPLYFYVSKHLVKPHILGFEDNVLDRHPSKFLSIKRLEASAEQ